MITAEPHNTEAKSVPCGTSSPPQSKPLVFMPKSR
jgi:hypothetical protein